MKNDFVAKTKVLSKPLVSKSVVSTAVKTQSAVHNKTSAASTVVQKTSAVQKQQRLQKTSAAQSSGFIPVETAVTKQLNRTDVKRNIQVTDVPPFHLHHKNASSSSYSRVPQGYEALKKVSKPRVNRHPFRYQQLLGKKPQQ